MVRRNGEEQHRKWRSDDQECAPKVVVEDAGPDLLARFGVTDGHAINANGSNHVPSPARLVANGLFEL